ncbi:MAG: hypothetical protein A3C80_01475 [Candidatus Ryanbacteria bacterium RIFCSPHIGHO2_02_FULL_45_43]|uniref:Bacterial sugar transferase domain-containing protein n=1 Tax=Candidatus Ryanbacteria bacterium RIFCSPHIGHO2_01_45_13 TaxID=1802112 RepID=A0A1G2FWZ2_9BACT|nr:MAG: hypothetical protein A2W41_00860 [Candidatus Ryanbacteria bacterium RIFCSPHIGHO2_01_45_13]OGZ42355.1 MAG: hypothetical protein A2718_02210 [Candidatus Ryanbacteria bacterium RIFCSPHIGHO2_01_FULL_44_130]OGZ48348.1 MAG: hypothetical protein A3C80_01475 [Candidatus Ryanbacteria bacterium RIFCSPHIGHO2_02_FULL_45_43]OGZ50458.1 MAG: hypothetical protein A3E55_03655 [Candidatus Ryanbacteria bacterium RIFCSPHIGHO2_12_FULL_44_20]OGZ52092.1 MAG: hypothetical protein A3A17_01420 [Candidatus Ryanba
MRWGKFQQLLLLLGDAGLLYLSLHLTLYIRYGNGALPIFWRLHITPFTIIFGIWLLIFYISRLYDSTSIERAIGTVIQLLKALTVGGFIAIALFYFVPLFLITPKTNLIIALSIAFILLTLWRVLFGQVIRRTAKLRVLIFGDSPEIQELINYIKLHPQLGYEITDHKQAFSHNLASLIKDKHISIVVASEDHQSNKAFVNMLYEILPLGISYMDFASFYEKLLGKIPISLISEVWFLENLAETEKRFFGLGKRVFDVVISIALLTIAVVLFPLIALLIKMESNGPVFYKHKRVGKDRKEFNLIKFRTMQKDAEKDGPQWAKVNDPRVTKVGKFLRKTRIDELPQAWDILIGDLSFIGPRPERPEFVNELRNNIPYYDMRLLVRPGLSGWAQINPPYYYGTEKEAYLKLQYDLFYIKNRGLGLDLSIALKTISVLLSRLGR